MFSGASKTKCGFNKREQCPVWAVGAGAQGSAGVPGCDVSGAGRALPSWLHPLLLEGMLQNRLTELLAMRWCLFSQALEEEKLLHKFVYCY